MSAASFSRVLASFVARAQPPPAAIEAARRAYLDTVGVALAGSTEPPARLVQALVAEESRVGPALVLGTMNRTSITGAALANGTAAHALDFDDVSFVTLSHPSAPLVAACLAVAERANACGRALLDAYCVGFEVTAILGRAMNPSHYRRGWHCTSTLGTLGAAASAARLLGLDVDATARCLGIAASHASGLKENFGTMTKPLHVGLAAQGAVQAALLAARGFDAAGSALDGPQGFLRAFDAEERDVAALAGTLGSRWEIVETGITVKLYPSCAATHPMLDALLDLRQDSGFGPDEVGRIRVGVDAMTPTVLQYDRPRTGLEGKFSLQYCAAAAVVHGNVGLDSFDDARIGDPAVQALLPRVTMYVDASLDASAPPLTQAALAVSLRDGRELVRAASGARGYPDRPASSDELAAKFRACAERVLPATLVDAALDRLTHLEELPTTDLLTTCLHPA